MFIPLPTMVLADFELTNLMTYIESEKYSPNEKYDKIRETIEGKTLPQDIEKALFEFFKKTINDESDIKIKEAILISFPHTNFKKTEYIFELCFEFIRLTELPGFIIDFENDHWGNDVLMIIEHKLSQATNSSIESRNWSCLAILAYLEGMITENKKLSFKQVDRLLDGLKNFGYDEFNGFGIAGYNKEKVDQIIEHYLNQFDSSLRARFTSKSILGKRRHTTSEIMEEMIKNLPKNLNR